MTDDHRVIIPRYPSLPDACNGVENYMNPQLTLLGLGLFISECFGT